MFDPSLRAFIDESSVMRDGVQEYRVCAVIIAHTAIDEIRDTVRPFLLTGQRKFHWKVEPDSRRKSFLIAIADFGFEAIIVTDTSMTFRRQERQRRKVLEHLYGELVSIGVEQITLESRNLTQDRLDIAHIAGLKSSGRFAGVRLTHLGGGEEPVLWIPDVILGATNPTNKEWFAFTRALERIPILQLETKDTG